MSYGLNSTRKRALRSRLMKVYGPWCARCGAHGSLTIDHIVPRSRGGGNEIGNLQLLCAACNSAKADGTLAPVWEAA